MFNWIGRTLGMSDDSARKSHGPLDDYWYDPIGAGNRSAAGVYVTPEISLHLAAVQDCLRVIAEPIASLPLKIFRRLDDGSKNAVDDHPLSPVLRRRANDNHKAFEFRGLMQWNLGLYSNAYAEIRPGRRGVIDQLIPIHPNVVRAEWRGPVDARQAWYEVTDPTTGNRRVLGPGEMWHLRGLPLTHDGLFGVSRVVQAKELIGAALERQAYAARFFKNDTKSGGIVKHPQHFKDDSSKKNWMQAWRNARSGGNKHRDVLLEDGMDYIRTAMTNEEAQFLETRKEDAVEIAGLWKVPPHKIGILDRATFSNIEQQALEFVSDTLLPWLMLWEQAITEELVFGGDDLFAEFNVAGLLRGDLKTRYEAYAIARNWGWLSVNDVRRLENLNPIADGDTYLQPLNMQEAGDPPEPSGQNRPPAAHDPRHASDPTNLRFITGGVPNGR